MIAWSLRAGVLGVLGTGVATAYLGSSSVERPPTLYWLHRHREDFTHYCPMCGRDAIAEIRRGEQGFCSEKHAEAYLAEVRERAVRAKES